MKSIKAKKSKQREGGMPLLLTEYAATKLHAYADIAGNDEFMTLLIGKKLKRDIVVDVFLLYDQSIGTHYVDVSGHGINKSVFEIYERYPEDEYHIIGWSHGHGLFDVFHSSTDDQNTIDVFLAQLAPTRLIQEHKASPIVARRSGKKSYVFSLDHNVSVKMTDPSFTNLPETLNAVRTSPYFSGCIYSLVVNSDHDHYCEKFSKHWCAGCDQVTVSRSKLDVRILPHPKDKKIRLNMKALKKEFNEKTKRPFFRVQTYRSGYGWGSNDGVGYGNNNFGTNDSAHAVIKHVSDDEHDTEYSSD
jgi:hypothetical protein